VVEEEEARKEEALEEEAMVRDQVETTMQTNIRKCGQHQPLSATVVAFDTPNAITSQNKECKQMGCG
jgi:hypothetical protein